MDDAIKNNISATTIDPQLEEMAKVGILFGRKRQFTNPKMRKYVFTTRNGVEIFDLAKTQEAIEAAAGFLKEAAKTGKPILLVGTEPPSQAAITALAEKFNFPYVIERWLGGTLTNFETINDRLQYYIRMKADLASGRLDKYTKKERVVMDKEIARLTHLFGGLEKLTTMPAAVLIVGAKKHLIVIREANKTSIPIVAIANSDANPDEIQYLIPANDRNKSSVEWIFTKLESAIEAGLKEKGAAAK